MGLFDKELTNFGDDVVLMEYNFEWSSQYKTNILRPKIRRDENGRIYSTYGMKTYVPAEVIWKHYMFAGGTNDIKYGFGFNIHPDKKLFFDFITKSNDIERLMFKNKIYFSQNFLHPLFDKYNELLLEEYMRQRYNEKQEDNEF